jgi:hypothetical protein
LGFIRIRRGCAGAAVDRVLSLLLALKIADVDARLSAGLLAPSARDVLVERVETLQVTRAGALDSHGAELRRIERDPHDGTQARLVSIAMRLGLAERELERDPQAVAARLAEAREGAEDAMTELRDVLRSMYPPILADRGLSGALAAVVARCSVPAELTVGDQRRQTQRRAQGRGDVDPGRRHAARRVAALDGTLTVTSRRVPPRCVHCGCPAVAVVHRRSVGYLLKDRIARVEEFLDTLSRVAGRDARRCS